jgi:glycosyltransferase involved in cell wall biosynthesis
MEIYDCGRTKSVSLPISVIILTYNDEKLIEDCLKSVYGWTESVFIVDSFSTDSTLEVVKKYASNIYQNRFENYSTQRNWALETLPINAEWVLNLDSDHRVSTELRNEIFKVFSQGIDENVKGFLISRKTIFMCRWIKYGGHYPVYQANLFRKGYGFCEQRLYDQHFVVKGKVKSLNNSVIDITTDSLNKFIEKHNRWTTLEAIELLNSSHKDKKLRVKPHFWGNLLERKRFSKTIYYKLPLLFRAFFYSIYRYFFRLGFLDGKEGLIYHFLQGFWFRFLVDSKIYEIQKKATAENRNVNDVIYEMYGIEVGNGEKEEGKRLEIYRD